MGNYFIQIMEPGEDGTVNAEMKSPGKCLARVPSLIRGHVLGVLQHQHRGFNLLEFSCQADLNTIRVPTTLHLFIKLVTGRYIQLQEAHESAILVCRSWHHFGK